MTTGALGKFTVVPGGDPHTVWEKIRALAADGGLPPLAAARLALTALDLIGSPGEPAVVEMAAVTKGDGARVQAVVYGGTGRCDDPAARLVDVCHPYTAPSGAAGQMAVVTDAQQAATHDASSSAQVLLRQAAERGGLPALLTAALLTLDGQGALAAEYRAELSQIRAELEATNQGLLALHTELSEQRDQLKKAQLAAERASEAKAVFLASMSHEIRSPLNAILGFSSLLQEAGLAPEQAGYVENLATAGSHLKDLVDGILDLSKVESGQLELEEVPFDLVACVDDAAELAGPQAEAKRLALATLIAPGVPEIVAGDPLRLRQILVNLLSNAVKFTDQGEITIEVAAQQAACEGEWRLVFDVHDTGPGIPDSVRDRLFDPFVQAETSTTRRYGGTGLGLAICKQLTERMGGRITVASTPGEGATFTAMIPFRQTEPTAPAQAGRPLTGLQVLLIHPQPAVAEAVRRHLVAWGAAVTTASSAADAARRAPEWEEAGLAVIGTSEPDGLPAAAEALVAAHDGRPLPTVGLTPLTWRPPEPSFPVAWTVPATPIRRTRLLDAVLGALGRSSPACTQAETAATRPVQALRILVAEDDPVNQAVITLLLQRLGHSTDVVGDGEEAVAAITRGDYDLVLMDINMPRLDGIAATREARAQRPGHHPPIIALTASATPGTRQACMRAGMTGFLTKPVQSSDLADLITSATQHPTTPAA